MAKILLVEDNAALAEAVAEALSTRGYIVEHIGDGKEALDRLKLCYYDLAILDWVLPGMTGLDVCTRFRAMGGMVPILMLTAKDKVSDKERAFDAGADEYITKPFDTREFLARVKALLRRPHAMAENILEADYLRVNVNERSVTKMGERVELTPAEYILLELFMNNVGRIFTFAELLARVFDTDDMASDEAVRQRVLRLRKKIDLDDHESLIKTVKGLGYKLETKHEPKRV